ncbi:hypothetical protein N1249_22855 (plasmid) [Enterobacter sp. CP102]|nr:hypothetical protein N1249_22855 [Enterobacter sp. CP102]
MMAQLGTFKSGEAVSLSFTLNVLDAASATYTLKDGRANIVAEDVPVEFEAGQMSVTVVVPAEYNQLADRERDLRRLVLTVNDGTINHLTEQLYVLMADFELAVPRHSFATIADAQMQAIDMLNGDALLADGDSLMRKRLIEATNRIKTMPFSIRRIFGIDYDDYDRPQNMLNVTTMPFGAAGQYRVDIVDWDELSDEDFAAFPDVFKRAVMLAVINEACEIANGNDVAAAREDGILSESIGETTNMYRTGKSAPKTVARTTWRLLAKYTNNRFIVRR